MSQQCKLGWPMAGMVVAVIGMLVLNVWGALGRQEAGQVLPLLQLAFVLLAALCLGVTISRRLAVGRGIGQLNDLAIRLGKGDLTADLGQVEAGPLAELFTHLNQALSQLRTKAHAVRHGAEGVVGQGGGLVELSGRMVAQSSAVEDGTRSARTEIEALEGAMASLSSRVEGMNERMAAVSSTARESAEQIGIIIGSTEEMSATIADIAASAEKARSVVGTAVANVNAASSRVDELGAAALEINKVTDVIVEIAEQTKLLALNATIEAARAGEAGKGFAVVANEVKELALQTNNAITEIRNKVEAMQNSTDNTITEIGAINQTIKAVNEIVVSIAGAVEEQSVTTRDIVSKLNQGESGIKRISTTVAAAAAGFAEVSVEIGQVTLTCHGVASGMEALDRQGAELKQSAVTINRQATDLLATGQGLLN